MRRLPDERSAEALLRRGALTPDHLTRLAARLARFFDGRGPGARGGRDRDDPRQRRRELRSGGAIRRTGSSRGTRSTPCGPGSSGSWSGRPTGSSGRVEQGRIRDGHGDLRLEHVYFEDAEPIVIDCVEFNERLRSGDAAADVAFLAMELTARSRADLAELFLAAFALESDDHDLYGVVDFYAGYRAWVRGKVAAFLAADPSTPPEKAARKAEEARSLFDLARSYAEARPGAPPVIAVGGLIGSGKSTLAEALGRATGVPVVSSDRVRKALAGVRATERAPEGAYSAAFSARTFDELFRRAAVVLDSGRGVVLDATFRERALRLRARDLARRHGRRFLFVETVCDEATLRERLRRRAAGPSVSDAGEAPARSRARGIRARHRARRRRARPRRHDGAAGSGRARRPGAPSRLTVLSAGRDGQRRPRRATLISRWARDEHEAAGPDRGRRARRRRQLGSAPRPGGLSLRHGDRR